MLKAFKYRLYPTASQAEKINQNIGCARLVYNLLLDAKIKHYKQHRETLYVTPAKFKVQDEYTFLKNADSLALSNAQLNLEKAFNSFFQKNAGYPKFKSKHKCRWSYTTNNQRNKKNPPKRIPFVLMVIELSCQKLATSRLLNIDHMRVS